MSSRSVRRSVSGDVLSALISGLEVLQAASNVVANVPLLNGIVSSALGLARTIEAIGTDRERFLRLARRVSELSMHIEESIDCDFNAIDDGLTVTLIELQALMDRIRSEVEKQLRRSALSRLLHQASISSTLEDHLDALDSAWRAFDTACLIALRMKMERQALYDDRSQVSLPQAAETLSLMNETRSSDCFAGAISDLHCYILSELVGCFPPVWLSDHSMHFFLRHHPYVSQVLGYSHPSVPEKLYVMESGMPSIKIQ
ncbi:hypothetical protein DICSQDRAFT_66645 [Dichomitus squalens LYAD-421 SS1]|uniref:Uncharacterized protein n=1 Tax=Dichomitus squalens (strain LYAD-421) TaxID=732165 RepID=R7SQX9_DICSQ|nr:uncharacterized protein DICSQDRAFT_66645 [Dichomitus squalens LYAD-421 SS1]EJF58589.1 hypothetical protein DICSQDRAFT_66645 [Dichomitus squalens LYAD-421 SS1]